MITNNLSRLDRYDYHNKRFQSAFDFLRNSDLLSLTPGTEISVGDGVLAKIQEYTTDPEDKGPHRTGKTATGRNQKI